MLQCSSKVAGPASPHGDTARPALFAAARNGVVKDHVLLCEDGHHCAIPRSKHEIDGITRAVCRFCGCSLMRMAASRRWFRCGEMGRCYEVR